MTEAIAAPVRESSAAAGLADLLAPLTRAGRDAFDSVAGHVQQYLERMEDGIHEARAERTRRYATEGLTVEAVLSSMDQAAVSSDVPGRVRLRHAALKRQDDVAAQTAHALQSKPGIREVEVNPLTGSVLILYDTKRYPSTDKLLLSIRMGGLAQRRRKKSAS